MLARLRKAFGRSAASAAGAAVPADDEIGQWAAAQGFVYKQRPPGFSASGEMRGRAWRMERGRPARDFIEGSELRMRAELGVQAEAAVLVMNRPLKDALEKRTYAHFTDSVQTTVDSALPEELRWLSMFPEIGWDAAPDAFWDRYAILADDLAHAQAWLSEGLMARLLQWPSAEVNPQTPFVLMLLRGKVYLRMQDADASLPTLAHAHGLFLCACDSALDRLAASE